MKKILVVTLLYCSIATLSFGQEKAHQIYNKDGNKISYKTMLFKIKNADVVLFGENHNDPISHWLQLELTKSLHEKHGENLMLGAEMLEADNQVVLDEYLLGFSREKDFEKEAKIWPNHKTDYRPLLRFAKENDLHFVATNIPRRFANMVYRFGVDTLAYLPEASKQFIAPLPMAYDTSLHCYKEISIMAGGHGGENLPKSQAIKDATMAHFILKNYRKGSTFIHYNGTYHSDNFEGIAWYLKQGNPNLKIVTIASVEQEKIDSLKDENLGIASFVLCTPESMTKTY